MGYSYTLDVTGKIEEKKKETLQQLAEEAFGDVMVEFSGNGNFWIEFDDPNGKWRNAEEEFAGSIVDAGLFDEGEFVRIDWDGEDGAKGTILVDAEGVHEPDTTPLWEVSDEGIVRECARRGLTKVTILQLGDNEDYALFVGKKMVTTLVDADAADWERFEVLANDLAGALGQDTPEQKRLGMCGLSEHGASYIWEDIEKIFAEGRDKLLREAYVRPDLTVHEVHPYGVAVVNQEGLYFAVAESFEAGLAFAENGDRTGVLAETEARDFELSDWEDGIWFLDGDGEANGYFDIEKRRLADAKEVA